MATETGDGRSPPFETPSQQARAKHALGGEGAEPPEKHFLEKNSPSRTNKPPSPSHFPYGRGQGVGTSQVSRCSTCSVKNRLGVCKTPILLRKTALLAASIKLPDKPLPARPRRATSPVGEAESHLPVRSVRGRAPPALAHPSLREVSRLRVTEGVVKSGLPSRRQKGVLAERSRRGDKIPAGGSPEEFSCPARSRAPPPAPSHAS